MEHQQLVTLEETARLAATEAAVLLRERWREPKEISKKGFRDWVTDADVFLQKAITDLILARHPGHGFLAEEAADNLPASGDVLWVVDPIDGTTNFSRQLPIVSISIAATWQGESQVGVILDPLRRELFSASRRSLAQCNGHLIAVSQTHDLAEGIVAFDWAHSRQARQATLDTLQFLGHEAQTLRAIGSAALALAWVAAGRLDAYWNWSLNAWDFAAGALIIEQAGGRCTTIDNKDLRASPGRYSCLATNAVLHEHLLTMLDRTPFSNS